MCVETYTNVMPYQLALAYIPSVCGLECALLGTLIGIVECRKNLHATNELASKKPSTEVT